MTTTNTTTDPAARTVEYDQLTRAQKALMSLSGDVAQQLAEDHGVCVRPLAMRRIDLTTGRVEVVPVPCGARREDLCRPCAEKCRRTRMTQCREGWHLEHEPIPDRPAPTETQKDLLAVRADLHAVYQEEDDETEREAIRNTVAVLDDELRRAGVTGRLEPLDPPDRPAVKRSTRRRQDAPNLPRRPVEKRTLGQVFGGKFRPSTFLTLTLDSYGRVDGDGAALDPDRYDYRRAARDAIHFPKAVDRFWQNARRCVGWEVQYFGTIEPQKRGAPHFHAAIRGSIPRAELRAITAATYHQVWWPHHDDQVYRGDHVPVWNDDAHGFVDPDTGDTLPTWDAATDPAVLLTPGHTVTFGAQVHVKGILGGTEEAGRHIGYLTKYLTKSVSQAAGLVEDPSVRQREHRRRLVAELEKTPCSPQCPIWLLYGVQPKKVRHTAVPGQCKGKAHRPEHLGIGGRRVLVSRKWSGKTLDDHQAERAEFVRQLLDRAGVRPGYAVDDGPFEWEKTRPGDPDVPTRPALLLHAISQRQRWKADYAAAQALAGDPPDDRSATAGEAA
ncbi:replication initiator protein [Pseudonocardia sp. KRD-184]|uniref:Replication initiator protein n=1 Tax=Pseudonocardia oceani TaxID=2792013 RepID=A0ABS6U751_9PSEU|nr:replication initiator [Pseudonocardia oceani]MBW0090625.1 replication initiator protein [Pseudonocardia oceani]MBW0097745.1 replication initiator protein [Pseudonocardia oceani]MBW0110318.1 replication initiator protein [Pseudonocardia oceani]MBW0120854.1 replication initiator protein [Pseudonocardia oceani]MBW0128065.1 replication initiator protein [Pseudonocardia oceani]